METKQEAKVLSKVMKHIGKEAGKDIMCILTNMDEPVGYSVGNSLEVVEAVKALKGEMSEDVKEIILTFGSYMLKMAGIHDNLVENKEKILEVIKNGKAYEKFIQMVAAQWRRYKLYREYGFIRKSKIYYASICIRRWIY